MTLIDTTIIVADDLTGANDTALQYFKSGKSAKIIIEPEQDFSLLETSNIWAISTESRNIDSQIAVDRVVKVCEKLKNELNTSNFYKKTDSTMRGNVGCEILSMLQALNKDAAVLAPAYIEEGRTTIGAYQLLQGMIIERTQCALDPKAPIYDSYIPDILGKNINQDISATIGCIGLNTVVKGAAVIISKIKELIEAGKKIIVLDAASTIDLEQIALAIYKSGFDILPAGSAGLAQAINKLSHTEELNQKIDIPKLPHLIVSGSATQLTHNQILKLKEEKPNIFYIDLTTEDIISKDTDKYVQKISEKLKSGIDVVIHSSDIKNELNQDDISDILIDAGIAKNEFPSEITNYLSELTSKINKLSDFILITIGGETSYKCAKKINSKYLKIADSIMPAIPLCIDSNGKIIVTKSGNFGYNSTLVDIINYFEKKKSK